MSLFWFGMLIGVVVGINLGVVVIGLLTAAKRGECGLQAHR